jgi:hypothetical protein
VATLLKGVIARQAKYIQVDPYAEAFTEDYQVNERKFELDSLLYPIYLSWIYWQITGDSSVFTPGLEAAFDTALNTMLIEQDHNNRSTYTYRDMTQTPVSPTGMIWSGWRPSDDNMVYHYNVPGNMMAVAALRALAQIYNQVYHSQLRVNIVTNLKAQIERGIREYGIIHTVKFGDVYAYEVDGNGHFFLADDGNIPSLLAAPYLGYVSASDPVYQNTRKMLLSGSDPYFFCGSIGCGIGSPHTQAGNIWPLSLVMQGLTAQSQQEKGAVLRELLSSDPGDHYLHESFNANNARDFTRENFGWPNSLFVEFIMTSFNGDQPLPTP